MKACDECKHLRYGYETVGCFHPDLVKDDIMYGKVGVSYADMRKAGAPCGLEGQLWEKAPWWYWFRD